MTSATQDVCQEVWWDTLVVGNDHAGLELVGTLATWFEQHFPGHSWLHLGTHSLDSTDYPRWASSVAAEVKKNVRTCGLLICGSGQGMAMAANRHPNVRAALGYDSTSVRLARLHNHANVLCLGARLLGTETANDCLFTFLSTPAGLEERHTRRVAEIDSQLMA